MEELKKVIEEIKQLNGDIKQLNLKIEQATLGTGEYKNISDEKISKILLKLEAQLVKLEADKEWFKKLVEEEKRNEVRNNTLAGPVQGLGKNEEEALIVALQAPETPDSPHVSVPMKLRKLGIECSNRDINYLISNDTAKYSLLKSSQLTAEEARTILTFAKSKIKSATHNAIGRQHSFFLDGSLNAGQGQAKSSLYYAFSESGVVLAAKVYNGNKESFLREVEINQALDHKNLVKFIKNFSIQGDARHIIIMPLFPRSVANWLHQDSTLPLAAVKIIARCCFDALCHLHSKRLCFADLKPSNIMLQNSDPSYATLVDYGAAVQIGSPIIEFTHAYCLDADIITATEHLDWICLGTTLAQIGGFDISGMERAADLVNEVHRSTKEEYLKNLILSCLQSPSSSKIEYALNPMV